MTLPGFIAMTRRPRSGEGARDAPDEGGGDHHVHLGTLPGEQLALARLVLAHSSLA